jgi:hypothetical protein
MKNNRTPHLWLYSVVARIFNCQKKPTFPDVKIGDKVTYNELGLSQFDDERTKQLASTDVFEVITIHEYSDKGESKVYLHCGTYLRLKWIKILPPDTPTKC